MKNGADTTSGVSAKSADPVVASAKAPEPSYTPLDIDDPAGRFGNWMPGDDPDDWR